MCNAITLDYKCGHTITFQRSTCRGTFSTNPRRAHPKALCKSYSSLKLRSKSPCGSCQLVEIKKFWQDKVDARRKKLRLSEEKLRVALRENQTTAPTTLEIRAEIGRAKKDVEVWTERFDRDLKKARREFPCRKRRWRIKKGTITPDGSPLKHEVRPEDISIEPQSQPLSESEERQDHKNNILNASNHNVSSSDDPVQKQDSPIASKRTDASSEMMLRTEDNSEPVQHDADADDDAAFIKVQGEDSSGTPVSHEKTSSFVPLQVANGQAGQQADGDRNIDDGPKRST